MAGAPKGNQNATKLKTPELKAEAYKQYCTWISLGHSKESWTLDYPHLLLTSETMEKYIRNNPIDFDPIHKKCAEAKSLEHWESLGKQMMKGEIKGAQPAIFQMFMRNKFGWDKENSKEQSNEEIVSEELVNLRKERMLPKEKIELPQ